MNPTLILAMHHAAMDEAIATLRAQNEALAGALRDLVWQTTTYINASDGCARLPDCTLARRTLEKYAGKT